MEIQDELKPIVKYLKEIKNVGDIYGFNADRTETINCLFWYYNGKVFDIQTNSWYNPHYANNRFDFGVNFVPSREYGSGKTLTWEISDMGVTAEYILKNIENLLKYEDGGKYKHYKNLAAHQKYYSFMVKVD